MFQLQPMSNAMRCIDQRFAFKNFRISCLALIFNLNNLRRTVLYAKKSVASCQIQRAIHSFFLVININLWLTSQAKWLRWVVGSQVTWALFLMSAETLWCRPTATGLLASLWHWASQCTDTVTSAFYIAVLSKKFLGFLQWRSCADRVVNLNTTISPPLFWRTWNWALASTRPHGRECCRPGTWAEIMEIVEQPSWLTGRSVASFIPDFLKIQKK